MRAEILKLHDIRYRLFVAPMLLVATSPDSPALVLSGALMTISSLANGMVIRAPDKTSARESGDEARLLERKAFS